jgi:flagellar L-ring protein precursor FlgH
MKAVRLTLMVAIISAATLTAAAQSSSIMRLPPASPVEGVAPVGTPGHATPSPFAAIAPKEPTRASTRAIELTSMIAIPPVAQRKFKPNDLINIIVRQQKRYEAEGKLDNKKGWDIDGKLSEWFRFHPRNRLGSDQLSNGQPGFRFGFNNDFKTDSQNEREDRFDTRIQATVIDVKPNGNLVIEAQMEEQHDEEHFTITLTGTCRSEDVTPTNSIFSTQIANLVLVEKNRGAVRDATTRGWIPRILDFAKPF